MTPPRTRPLRRLLLGNPSSADTARSRLRPPSDAPLGVASFLNTVSKYVASRTLLLQLPNCVGNFALQQVGVVPLQRLLQGGGDIVVLGSGDLAQTLMENGLIDVYDLWVYPIVLGTGKRLFREEARRSRLKLVKIEISTTGVAMLTYERGDG